MTRRTPEQSAAVARAAAGRNGKRSAHLWESKSCNVWTGRARVSGGTSKDERVPGPFPIQPRYSKDPSLEFFRVGSQVVN